MPARGGPLRDICTILCAYDISWRRGRDSNPRYGVTVRLISSQVHSTTLPPLRSASTNSGAHFTSNLQFRAECSHAEFKTTFANGIGQPEPAAGWLRPAASSLA